MKLHVCPQNKRVPHKQCTSVILRYCWVQVLFTQPLPTFLSFNQILPIRKRLWTSLHLWTLPRRSSQRPLVQVYYYYYFYNFFPPTWKSISRKLRQSAFQERMICKRMLVCLVLYLLHATIFIVKLVGLFFVQLLYIMFFFFFSLL